MSNETLRTALTGLTVTGMGRVYDQHPETLEVADLPAMWPDGFGSEHDFQTYSGSMIRVVRTAELRLAVKPLGMSSNDERQDARITIADALETALKADNLTGFNFQTLSIESESVDVNGTAYAGLIASITVQEVN